MTEQTNDIKDQEVDLEEEREELDEVSLDTAKKAYQKRAQKAYDTDDEKEINKQSAQSGRIIKKFGKAGHKAVDSVHRKFDNYSEETEQTGEYMEDQEKDFDASQDIDAIFSGEGLSEEFKSNAKAIFEAAVLAKVDEHKQALEEEYSERLEEELTSINENLVNKVDEYLEYVVTEWLEENKLAVESGIKAEIAEDFMLGLKNLFTEHYIDIPEEKVDIVEQFSSKVEELESELDKAISDNKSLSEEIKAYKKSQIMTEVSEGLSEVQIAKFKTLAENVEFVSEKDYSDKLALTKKKYFETINEDVAPRSEISDEVDQETQSEISPLMEKYVRNISRITRK